MKKKRSTPIDSKTNMKRGIWRHVKCKERKNIYIYIYIYIKEEQELRDNLTWR